MPCRSTPWWWSGWRSLRGPAALLYGGSAVGGVVNAIDNRVPRSALGAPSGAVEARFGGAATERGVSGLVEAGGGGFALHADAFWRKTEDTRVPEFDRPVDGGTEQRRRIVNSASRADGGAVGASMVWDHGHLGAAVDTYRNTYGIVAEEDVIIRMKRDKLTVSGELRDLGGPIRTLRGQLQSTDYRHEEVEGTGEVGTTFKNKGTDSRFELEHAAVPLAGGSLRGVSSVCRPKTRASRPWVKRRSCPAPGQPRLRASCSRSSPWVTPRSARAADSSAPGSTPAATRPTRWT